MTMRLVIYGDKIDLADELLDEFKAVAKMAIGDAGNIVVEEVKRLLSLQSGGGPAEAGLPPAEQTGALLRSVKRIPPKVKGRTATSGFIVDDPGAIRLNYGKTDARGIRTFPHPFAEPALANAEAAVGALLQERMG